jgi:hypothetical protein
MDLRRSGWKVNSDYILEISPDLLQLFSEDLRSRWRKIDHLVQTSHEQSIQSQQCQIQEITTTRLDTQQTPPRVEKVQTFFRIGRIWRRDEQQKHKIACNREICSRVCFRYQYEIKGDILVNLQDGQKASMWLVSRLSTNSKSSFPIAIAPVQSAVVAHASGSLVGRNIARNSWILAVM